MIVSIILPAVPVPLLPSQEQKFFKVLQSSTTNRITSVTQWQDNSYTKRMWVAVNYENISGSSFLFFSVNSEVLAGAYNLLGYYINDKYYKAVSVYTTVEDAPTSVQVPS